MVVVATALACGNVDSKQPPRPEVGGAESGGSGNGGSASGAGGEAWVADIICPSFPGGRREGRLKYQGTNGRFEDHCDELGRLVQHVCTTMVYCTPTPANPCAGDSGVAYPTGARVAYHRRVSVPRRSLPPTVSVCASARTEGCLALLGFVCGARDFRRWRAAPVQRQG